MGRLAVVGGADLLRQAGGRAAGCAAADGCRRWALAAGCCCEVWRCRCAGNGQAVQLMGCGVIGAALVPVPVCCWQAVQVGGVICCGGGALAWSSSGPRGHRAGQECGRAGRWAKEKGQGRRRGVRCCSGLWSALAWWYCCAGPDLVQAVGGGGLFPCSGAGPLLALALFQAQRFQLATFQRVTGCAGGAPSGPFLPFAGGVRFST